VEWAILETEILTLAAAFKPAEKADWLALVKKTLKGAGVETLRGLTADGCVVEPLYTDSPRAFFSPAPRAGDRAWDIRAVVAHPDRSRANAQALENLSGGASSLLLRLDPAGERGVVVGSGGDLGRLLEGVLTDLAPVALDAGFLGPVCAEWLAGAAKSSPVAPLALHLDPISAFAEAGVSPGPIEAHVICAADVAARLAETYPKASLFLASGRVAHEAGGSPAWELAVAITAALAYARAMVHAGMSRGDAFHGIVVGVNVDADALASIVKLRAARMLWAKITAACAQETPARIEARSSDRMLTRADPWTNLVRLTSAGFAGAVGGADAIVLANFTDAIGLPSALARRLARNTQLVLMEEAHVGAVVDPAAGSWAIETQTDDLARAAWRCIAAIEDAGGVVEALRSGLIADAVATARAAFEEGIATKALRILGVTDFPDAKPTPPEIDAAEVTPVCAPDPRLSGLDSHCPPLTPIRFEELVA
jgi:methylmalonyl-CoA mutase